MPLDVTAGPPLVAVGAGPPGLAVGSADAGPPARAGTPPFAALLAQQALPTPATPTGPPKSALSASETTKETDTLKDDEADATDPQPAATPNPLDATALIDWTALAALQATPPAPALTSPCTTDAVVSSAPTSTTEVMDMASVPVPAAPQMQVQTTGRELLPAPTDTPVPPSASSDAAATPGASSVSDVPESAVPTAALPGVAPSRPMALPAAPTAPEPSAPAAVTTGGTPQVPSALQAAQTSQATQVAQAEATLTPGTEGVTAAVAGTPFQAAARRPTSLSASGTGRRPLPTLGNPATTGPWRPALASAKNAAPLAGPVTDPSTAPVPAATIPNKNNIDAALQNDASPANNTGRTASSGAAAVPLRSTTAPAGETGDGRPATVTDSQTPVFSPENAAPSLTFSRSGRLKGEEAEEVVPSPPSTLQAGDTGANGAAEMAPVLPTDSALPNPSAGGAPKPMTGAERAQVIRQIADGVATIKPQVIAHGQGQMTLDLHPKEWGDLRVTVTLTPGQTDDGLKQTVVTAHVVAGSPAVKAALETHTAELNRALHETGLRLERLTVTVQAANAGGQSGDANAGGSGSGQQSSDRWQAAPSQDTGGNAGPGGGSSFAAFSGRQGGGAFQSWAASRSASAGGAEADTGVPGGPARTSAGFDGRA